MANARTAAVWIGLVAAATAATTAPPRTAAAREAVDLALAAKFSDTLTMGPGVRLTVRNRGTEAQPGTLLEIYADEVAGAPLWSQAVDLDAGGKVVVEARVYPDASAGTLLAVATPSSGPDGNPGDNAARGALWIKGRKGIPVAGRAVFLRQCASCHGDDASGTAGGPGLVGASPKAILAASAVAPHEAPWPNAADAKALSKFLKAPGAVVAPLPPAEPAGGWPGYAADVNPLLMGHCKACHAGGNASAGIRVDTYDRVERSARAILGSVKSGSMPQAGRRLTAEEVALLADWITGGKRP
jgi:mono/diheme cytochrome c family protein